MNIIAPSSAIGAQSLSFAYTRTGEPILTDVTVEIPSGAITTLTGPSGTGKSTLLYLLALMISPSSGTVVWHGAPASTMSDAQRARLRASQVGFVFQDALLDPSRTVIANVCDGGLFAGMRHSQSRARALELLERFGVSHRAEHRPGDISGGQGQRVAVCRALLTNPPVVFADEPTGNLDDDAGDVVWTALREHANNGATVIVATHDSTLAARSDLDIHLVGDGSVQLRARRAR